MDKKISKYGQLCVGDKFVTKIGEPTWVKVQPGTCCKSGVANAHKDGDKTVTAVFKPRDRVIPLSSS